MSEIKDDQLSRIDRQIASLMEERQQRIDDLNDPVRARIKELYIEIASRLDELHELGDPALHEEEIYVGYDEHEMQEFPVAFHGKFFSYYDGNIKEK